MVWFMGALRKGLWGIDVIAAVVVIAMMLHIALNAFMRSFFNHPLQNTLEVTQFWYLPLVALLGLTTAMRHGEHIGADLLVDRFSKRAQDVISGVMGLVSTVFCAAVTYFSFLEAIESMSIGLTGGVTAIPIWPVIFVVPLSFVILTVLFVSRSIHELRYPGIGVPDSSAHADSTSEQSR